MVGAQPAVANEAASPCAIRRLSAKGDEAVLAQLLSLEKKLFKKADNWGDLLIKETQRRNTFLLYVQAPGAAPAAAADASPPAGSSTPAKQHPPAAHSKQPQQAQHARARGKQPPQQPAGRPQPQDAAPAPTAPAVVGYIVYSTNGLAAHISKLAVAPEWRRRGVARALVQAAVQSARTERRAASVSLHVDCDNAPALALYRGEGFKSEALLEDYYCRGRHAHKMRLELGSC